jgi:hypothetical protein
MGNDQEKTEKAQAITEDTSKEELTPETLDAISAGLKRGVARGIISSGLKRGLSRT